MNAMHYPHTSTRSVTYGHRGMVATSQNLAAQEGLAILKQGGNAIDAAIATAACLTVVEPTSNGIGGDNFAQVWYQGKLYGLNSSGPAPKNISIEAIKALGHEKLPVHGVLPITIPGAVAGWVALSERFGKLSLADCLAPAIAYARDGFAVSPVVAQNWARAHEIFTEKCTGPEYSHWFDTFGQDQAPAVGALVKLPGHAITLQSIGETKGESFYRGALATQMADFIMAQGGYLSEEDLASYAPEWVEPIRVTYQGHDIWELPPNGQGIVALMAMGIMKQFPYENSVDYLHKQIEAIKLAFATAKLTVTDPAYMGHTTEELLAPDFLKALSEKITHKATIHPGVTPTKGGTVYLATADGEGNMVSLIQSNYMGFGSGIVIPGTGIAMNNRGHDFSLDVAHANSLQGGKRTYHTIIPGFITKEIGGVTTPVGPFGVMGGYMQPQGHVQVVSGLLDQGLNPQSALDAPRWQWLADNKIEVEHHFPNHVARELVARGHVVSVPVGSGSFGRGQVIVRDPLGTLAGGCEPRADSAVATW